MKSTRKKLLEKRKKITANEIARYSTKVINTLTQTSVFLSSKKIALYLPHQGEIDLTNILLDKKWSKKRFYLPIIDKKHPGKLLFGRFCGFKKLVLNKFNIAEPEGKKTDLCPAEKLDLVITPLVGFDQSGTRMGRGAGYYDQTFACKLKTPQHKPYLVGVAYSWQGLKKIKRKSWDVPLEMVVTEKDISVFVKLLIVMRNYGNRK